MSQFVHLELNLTLTPVSLVQGKYFARPANVTIAWIHHVCISQEYQFAASVHTSPQHPTPTPIIVAFCFYAHRTSYSAAVITTVLLPHLIRYRQTRSLTHIINEAKYISPSLPPLGSCARVQCREGGGEAPYNPCPAAANTFH